ncbi:extracellular solute-binding protein [Treponema sp. Marseille-Q4523]|uniref:extracellular solute-binding protein n=1 Tax=Treponema sp. Marseille-Q4523 TaxID=2810610 RepID=UPI00195F70CA|nr:extracellular solute-binding protein [Treponema sp. Marseille-Q4523]MBM7023646.1 extracellular solute-binding protein [Treponema sp. Marseille-Q4523]
MKKVLVMLFALCVASMLAFSTGSGDNAGTSRTVVVYSSHDSDPLNAAVNDFMAKYPSIRVDVVSLGGSQIFSRLEAEAANPLADVVWGAGVDTVDNYSRYLETYVSKEDPFIAPQFKDPEQKWYADSLVVYCTLYNKKLVGTDIPKTWQVLADSKWKGKIAMADPTSSGSAYVQVCSMLFLNGTKSKNYEDGWPFITRFYRNLNGIIQSSSGNCHKMVADGEYAIGLTLEKFAVKYTNHPDVEWYYADEGTAAVGEGIALVKGAKNPENAKLFIDFILSKECQEKQSVDWARRSTRSDDITPYKGLPSLKNLKILNYDLQWASDNNKAVKGKWQEIVVNN